MENTKNKPIVVKSPPPQVQAVSPTQPPVPPLSPQEVTSVPVDFLSHLNSEKYVKALVDGADEYLVNNGWTKEGQMWREPAREEEKTVPRKIEVLAEDGRTKKTIEQLVIPALPWIYNTRNAIARQQRLDANVKVA